MKEELQRKLEVLEALKQRVVDSVTAVDEERLGRPAAPGKWSPAQIIDHVVTSEGRSLQYIQKKTLDPESIPRATLMCAVRTAALVTALSSPFKFRAPVAVSDVPDKPSAVEAVERWASVRSELRTMLSDLPEDVLRRALFRHPVAGRMNMTQTMDFMIAHLRRHSKQLYRALG